MRGRSLASVGRRLSLVLLLLGATDQRAAAQAGPQIVVESNSLVLRDPHHPYIEPHLAVSPVDPDHLVAVASRADTSWYAVVALTSWDEAETWHSTVLSECDLDAWVAFLSGGEPLVSCLERGDGPAAILLYRSDDGGRTWGKPVRVPRGGGAFDHPSIAVDLTNGPMRGAVYAVALHAVRSTSNRLLTAPALSRSSDGGRAFGQPLRVDAANVWSNALNVLVLRDGTVGFAFVDYAVPAPGPDDEIRALETPRVWWARSTDGGRSISRSYLITELHDQAALTRVAADTTSGPLQNQLYFVVDDVREDAGGVFVFRSTDVGETWSDPVRLSRDTGRGFRRTPAVAVNHVGQVLVAWFQPQDGADRSCWQLMGAVSTDGAVTFSNPAPIADRPTCNRVDGNQVPRPDGPFNVADRWPNGGDYFGLAAQLDGSFQALWSDSRSGIFQLWMSRIEVRSQ